MSGQIIIDTSSNQIRESFNFNKKSFSGLDLLKYYGEVIDKKVTGWIYPADILLLNLFKDMFKDKPGDFCELGVAFGKSAILMSLLKNENEKLYLYDFFVSDVTPEQAKKNVDQYGEGNNVEWRIQDLMKLTPDQIKFDQKLKILHIDSCHQYTALKNDLCNFASHVEDYGIIAVDDYNDAQYPGVNSAVMEFAVMSNWKIFCIGANKAYFCLESNLIAYRAAVIDYLLQQGFPASSADIFGFEVILLCGRDQLSKDDMVKLRNNEYERFYG